DGNRHVGAHPEAEVVRLAGAELRERRPAERHEDLRRRRGEALAGADEERHAVPPPRIDVEADRRVGLDRRLGTDALLLPVATVLAAYEVGLAQRTDHPEDLHLLV